MSRRNDSTGCALNAFYHATQVLEHFNKIISDRHSHYCMIEHAHKRKLVGPWCCG